MSYKDLYAELAQILSSLRCSVNDHDCIGYCQHSGSSRAFIFISPSLNFKQKYFVLAHEAGHLFYMKKGKVFNWATKPRTEDEANWFAVQLLRLNNISSNEYRTFYNKTKKKKRRKSWFEI